MLSYRVSVPGLHRSWKPLPKDLFMHFFSRSLCCLILATAPVAASQSQELPAPKTYLVTHTAGPVTIDGKLDDAAWAKAAWSTDFVDIEGSAKPNPRFRTRVKMLWDEQYLYIAAELEEPNVSAKLTEHDSVIFHDNDFEVFLKPLPATDSYYEFEMNALNTGWDLFP